MGSNFISTNGLHRSVPTYTAEERTLVRSIVATLTIKRIPDPEIIKAIIDRPTRPYQSPDFTM